MLSLHQGAVFKLLKKSWDASTIHGPSFWVAASERQERRSPTVGESGAHEGFKMVRKRGFEPPRSCDRQPLKLSRNIGTRRQTRAPLPVRTRSRAAVRARNDFFRTNSHTLPQPSDRRPDHRSDDHQSFASTMN